MTTLFCAFLVDEHFFILLLLIVLELRVNENKRGELLPLQCIICFVIANHRMFSCIHFNWNKDFFYFGSPVFSSHIFCFVFSLPLYERCCCYLYSFDLVDLILF